MSKEPDTQVNPDTQSQPDDDRGLQRTIFRRLFREPVFNQMDGLDDYDNNFKSFHNLVDVVTSDMRHRMETALTDNRPSDHGYRDKPSTETPDSRATGQPVHSGVPLLEDPVPPVPIKLYSGGKIVIIGERDRAMRSAVQLQSHLTCTLLIVPGDSSIDGDADKETVESLPAVYSRSAKIEGAFTRFTVSIEDAGSEITLGSILGSRWEKADLILDLQSTPLIPAGYDQPMGYFAPGDDEKMLEDMLLLLKNMTGEFEKDIFVTHDAARCCHKSRGVYGCRRCIDLCPAHAVKSGHSGIEIDHLLCRGCGVCSLGCPGGALSFEAPGRHEILEDVQQYLESVADKDFPGPSPVMVIHGTGKNPAEHLSSMPDESESFYFLPLDSVGAAGIETWMTFLAWGFDKIVLYLTPGTDPVTAGELEHQVNMAGEMLRGIGLSEDCISVLDSPGRFEELLYRKNNGARRNTVPGSVAEAPDVSRDKRALILEGLNSLRDASKSRPGRAELSEGAPFGEIRISKNDCTFCMACAAVCPTGAITAGTDHPRIIFREADCMQCGICMKACPENAVTLRPGIMVPPDDAYTERVLAEEPPLLCIRCGKPFAPRATISRITDKLRGHWMYQDAKAVNRLRMCRDCRVSDIFTPGKEPVFKSGN